jgi:Bacterial alpha-L-rhamnosidase 6 hairpin glycosidase domain/F5/8 type C domain
MAAAALLAPGLLTAAAPTAAADSPSHPWDTYNYAPTSRTVSAKSVYRTTGSVADPAAVLDGKPTTLTGSGSSVTLDFGEEVGGLVTVHATAATGAGQQLGLAFTESSQYVGTSSDASNGGGGPDGALTADLTPGASWTMPQAKLRGGFRYLTLFDESGGPISLDSVTLAISFAPSMANLRDYANYFYSSDPLLNRIWYAGAYTAETNTIAPTTGRVWGPPSAGWDNSATVGVGDEVLVDGAKRDRTVWPGDLGVSVPTEYASLGDLIPTRNALTTLFDHQAASGELPYAGPEVNFYGSDTYHLWTLIGTANYYQYSHDSAWLASEWPNYVRALNYSLAKVGSDGLMNVTETADWARGDQGGENIEANALLYRALVTGAELARTQGDSSDAASWDAAAAKLKDAANAKLWDDAVGEYRDNPTSSLYPQDGNSLAVWYGIASTAQAARVSTELTANWNQYGATTPEKNGEIGTFPGSMEVQAHFQAGDASTALELIRREWGYMLNSPLGTGSTFWEGYLANGQFGYGGAYMSAAHGWSTGPTSALTFYVLGIRPTTATGAYDIMPETGDLASAQGSLKTPLGDITVSWHHDVQTRSFTEDLSAPTTAVGKVEVPTYGARTTVIVNGETAWAAGHSRAYGAHLEGNYVVLTGLPPQALIHSVAAGNVPTKLSASVSSGNTTPVLPGASTTIPVTVQAVGDQVVSGSVTATVPSGWTVTPGSFSIDTRNGPGSQLVDVVVHAPSSGTGGDLTVPIVASAGHVQATATAHLLQFGAWPQGTTATASSYHAPNVYNGQVRTYDPGNAIDDNLATFWNDDTPGAFPDTLTITAPSAVTLNGVGFASIIDGVPTDFSVQTWDGTQWTTQATVTGNSDLYRWIPFPQPVSTTQVRVVVTASQTQNGNFTRIAELAP